MADDFERDADEAAVMAKPVTRAEFLYLVGLVQFSLLSQSLFNAAMLDGDDKMRREFAEEAVAHTSKISRAVRKLLDAWSDEA